jgi:hypothetical protein
LSTTVLSVVFTYTFSIKLVGTVEQCYYLSDARCEDPLAPFVGRDSELCTNIQVPEFKHDPRSVGIIFIIEGRGQVRGGFQLL